MHKKLSLVLLILCVVLVILITYLLKWTSNLKESKPRVSIDEEATSFRESIPFETILTSTSHDYFSKDGPFISVIQNQDELKSFFNLQSTDQERENLFIELNKFEFELKTIIILSGGIKSSTGYYLNPIEVIENENKIMVYIDEIGPGRSCILGASITYPCVIIAIDKFLKPVEPVYNKIIKECN